MAHHVSGRDRSRVGLMADRSADSGQMLPFSALRRREGCHGIQTRMHCNKFIETRNFEYARNVGARRDDERNPRS